MSAEAFEFNGPRGYRISGRLELPDDTPQGWAILVHCFTSGEHSSAASRLARALAARGIGVLRFNFAGQEEAGGPLADTTFATDVEDLVAAGEAMARAGKSPSILVGHSFGGVAVLMAAAQMPGIRAAATLGAPFDIGRVLHESARTSLQAFEAGDEVEVSMSGQPFVLRKSFVDKLARHDFASSIAGLQIPLLILHSPQDATVSIENAARIFTAAKFDKIFTSLDKADHLLTQGSDADYAAARVSSWASGNLGSTY
jgi:putative redox protein